MPPLPRGARAPARGPRGGPGRGGPGRGGPGRGGPGRGSAAAIPKKKRRRKDNAVKLRPVFWSTLHYNKIHSTIFHEINDQDITMNILKLENKFQKNNKKSNKNDTADGNTKKESNKMKKPTLVSIVDGRRSQNCGIALCRFVSLFSFFLI